MMTDWQLEHAAGEAIGLVLDGQEDRDAFLWIREDCEPWLPLSNDAQAMRLVKALQLHIDQRPGKQITVQDAAFEYIVHGDLARGGSALNHAIVKCACVIARARNTSAHG